MFFKFTPNLSVGVSFAGTSPLEQEGNERSTLKSTERLRQKKGKQLRRSQLSEGRKTRKKETKQERSLNIIMSTTLLHIDTDRRNHQRQQASTNSQPFGFIDIRPFGHTGNRPFGLARTRPFGHTGNWPFDLRYLAIRPRTYSAIRPYKSSAIRPHMYSAIQVFGPSVSTARPSWPRVFKH
ncbi:hypothetical protein LR48_Vigan01g016900 [Vigna angularis]|uniref:Uncharacterized protein n=1 Tax=Phaseolus angularis TaxID=3914 RepID=A0A0L9TJ80_PHAAN|nr:hypothetical protein LR48_Vigan01g016900 [Vigna angularis]